MAFCNYGLMLQAWEAGHRAGVYEANVADAITAIKDVHDRLLKGSTSPITKKSIELMPGDEYERRFKTEPGFREAVDKALGTR